MVLVDGDRVVMPSLERERGITVLAYAETSPSPECLVPGGNLRVYRDRHQRRPAPRAILGPVKPLTAQRVGDQPGPTLGEQFLVRQSDASDIVALVQRGVWSAIPVRAASRCAGSFFPRRSALRSIPAHAAALRK